MDEEAHQTYIGVNLPARQGISNQRVVDAALAQGYDLITSRITSRTYRKRVQSLYASSEPDPEIAPPIGEDLVVLPGPHVSNTIALCAPWAELDSKDLRIADLSYKVLEQEMAYAKFCGLPYVVIEGPKRRTHLARYAHSLQRLLRKFTDLKIMVHTTFTEDFRDGQPPPDVLSTWEVWDGIRVMCDYPPNLGVTLEVQHARLPEFVISRWLSEPVMMLVLGEARAFVPNPKNYPVLPRHTQVIIKRLLALNPFLLIKENLGPNKMVQFNGGDDACLIYLRNLLAKPDPRHSVISQQSRASRHTDEVTSLNLDIPSAQDVASGVGAGACTDLAKLSPTSSNTSTSTSGANRIHSRGHEATNSCDSSIEFASESCHCEHYADVLEIPLQPLRDSLDSGIYEVFETDVTKYNQYYRAVSAALADFHRTKPVDEPLTIAVLGAGRGALVDRVLDAIVVQRLANLRYIRVYAVEKHAGPIAYLYARKASEPVWESVEVVHADMRYWHPKQPADLVVSELLGSLGDNELSPECLSHIERNPRVLAPNGVIIPSSYSSYLVPIFSPQLWSKARARSEQGLETPYVVCLHQAERVGDPQLAWSFEHPSSNDNTTATKFSSRRCAKLSFPSHMRTRVYGFAGYFDAELYAGIKLSTVPANATPGLNSWFPMYFPIQRPLDVLAESTIELSIWRERSQRRIWYEWAMEVQMRRVRIGSSTIHNCDGHAQSIHF